MISRKKKNVRLPAHIVPMRYDITLKPDLEAFTFEGKETIHLSLKKAAKKITLHSKELDIRSAEIVRDAGKGSAKEFALRISYDEKAETATFAFPRKIPRGDLELRLIFSGILNDKMRGFYRSRYEVRGKTRHLATTQFEATDARRAFPCFDEPALKAKFDVTLVVPEESTAISNTLPVAISEHEGGYKVVKFATTPAMSTYLLAFIVGDFESIEKKTKEGVLVRVWTTPGKKHQAAFALDCAVRTLSFFGGYFDIPYPLPVLDLIAIPDFAAFAMENWGAVTYREIALLVDPEHSSAATRQRVAMVIAHELAHQWFGNLVTMEWWTHLWLNEGFASYMEYFAVDRLFPKWDTQTQFVMGRLGDALMLDALMNTHPIEVDVHHPDEIGEIFDDISYSKGASVIHMLADYLGKKDFRDGLRYYLKKHSYANTSTVHLWKAFEKISGKPVTKMMSGWTRKPGYPLLTVSEGKNGLAVRQERFFANPVSRSRSKAAGPWFIPVSVMTDRQRQKKQFLMKEKNISLPKYGGAWFKLNAGEAGVFRTSYPENILKAFKEPLRTGRFNARDRLGLIRDVMALAGAGKIATTDALDLAAFYKKETDYAVWTELASDLNTVALLVADEPCAENYHRFARDIFAGIAKKVGWQKKRGEDHLQTLLRGLVLLHFGMHGDPETIARAKKTFSRATHVKNSLDPDVRMVVYAIVARYGGRKEQAKLMKMYRSAALHEEKNRIGRALAAFNDKNLLKKTLSFSLSGHVRLQDAVGIISWVWVNPAGKDLAWSFVKANWKTFLERYGGGHDLAHLLALASCFTSLKKAKEIERFFKKNPAPGAARTIAQVLEKIRGNAAWLARDQKAIEKHLTEF